MSQIGPLPDNFEIIRVAHNDTDSKLTDLSSKVMLKSTYDTNNSGSVDLAEQAVKLQTARTITIAGDASGSASFDGSQNIQINVTGTGGSTTIPDGSVTTAKLANGAVTGAKLANNSVTGSTQIVGGSVQTAQLADGAVTMAKLDAAVIDAINSGGGSGGSGDMLKSVYDTNNNGVVDQAAKLQTARTIALTGSVSGTASFDGSANITIVTTGSGGSGGGTAGALDLKANFGAVGNGVADDTSKIQAALNSGAKIIVPPGVYLITADLSMNVITSILEGVNAKFKSTSLRTINITAGTGISGITFENVYLYLRWNHTNPGKFLIDRCTFKAFYGVRMEVSWTGTGFQGAMPENVQVTNCVFDGHSYGIYGAASSSYFAHNLFKNTASRNIELNAGSDNLIYDNRIYGGVTGIIFLIDCTLNQRKPVNRNIIHCNHVFNVSEEAISLDGNADTAGENASRVTGTVASLDSSTTARIIPSFSMSTANVYTEFYVTFHTGKSRGQSHRITTMGAGGTSYLEIPTADKNFISVGDKITVVIGCVGNIISNNIVKVAQTGITAYGCGVGTIIEGNHVEDCFGEMGILIRSLYGTSGGDLDIVHNSLVQGNVVWNCEIAADINYWGSTPITTLAVGNKFQDNTVINGHVIYEYQYDNNLCLDNTATGSKDNTAEQPAQISYTANGVPMRQTVTEAGASSYAFAGLAYDLFNRADSSSTLGSAVVGGAWTAANGTWGISSNEAYSVSDATNNIAVLPTVGTGNYIVTCAMKGDIDSSANRRRPALVFRYVDSNNFMLAYLEEGRVFIGKSDGGTTSDLASYPHRTVDNTWYNFKVICKDDIVKLSVNGVWVASHVLTQAEQLKYGNAGQVGMRLSKTGSPSVAARWNNLVVESVI
ncbi:hypothetical protein ACFPPD_26265 [Cohnella suwonensis]|uniref:Pectate lyase superfamily protein domain-containing protein n=1 Tax=Cohnella suwonensis TaxID=696072 RepID=A0ABW0M5F2_9BACL